MHIKQFLTPTKAAKKSVVYDTINNVIQVKEMEELKIDTSFKQQQGMKSPNSQPMSPNSQPMSPNKQASQANSPAVRPQVASPAAKTPQHLSQPNSPTKQASPRHVSQAQFSPAAPKSPVK